MTPQQHCDHEPICHLIWQEMMRGWTNCERTCSYDTRSLPTPSPSELAATAYQAGIECGREEGAAQAREESTQGRKVITLCGSVKFWDEYREWNARLTLEGNIVFSCGLSLKEGYEDVLIDLPIEDVKKDLDFIHLRKIDLSDEIFVLNVGGYIGESTKREIAYAESKGKMVKFLESLRTGGDE